MTEFQISKIALYNPPIFHADHNPAIGQVKMIPFWDIAPFSDQNAFLRCAHEKAVKDVESEYFGINFWWKYFSV